MNNQNALRLGADHLSVIHKASVRELQKGPGQDVVINTDLNFNITGWNVAAQLVHGKPGAMGKNLFSLVDIGFIDSTREELRQELRDKGSWTGEVSFNKDDGANFIFRTTATYILDENGKPASVLILCHDISDTKRKERELFAAEKKYEILMNTLQQGVLMIDKDVKITACNKRGAEILNLPQELVLEANLSDPGWQVMKADGTPMPFSEFPAVVSLQTGFPQRNVVMGIGRGNNMVTWISVNSEALILPGEFEPYAAVISFTDITDSIFTEKELKKSNERFYYASQITSDAIWDIDLETREIYRSDAFLRLSGYTREQIGGNLDWWFNKVHHEDRARVRRKVNEHIEKGPERWEDEYRFECADGSFKYLCDSGILLYRNGKPVRILGAIRDLTEKKKLEKQLLDEQALQHKAITQASLIAQEQEKSHISRELHDNVNQILMSARLFMDTARRKPEDVKQLLDKAIEYQLLALQEIRKLTKSLSTAHIKAVGLRESVKDIIDNLNLLNLQVQFIFNTEAEKKLSDEQRLMLFRIIQEQSNNIIKYADAKNVWITINESEGWVNLRISDDGVGFDPADENEKGIGFINISNRTQAYNGKLNVISAPGRGCTLEVSFPLNS